MTLTRAERKARTREQLIEAALRSFQAKGFAATTLEQIAEEAGVTTGAVYSNFSSKEDLFLELVRRFEPHGPDVSMLSDRSMGRSDRFRRFGEVNGATADASVERVATALEVRAFALRNERARRAVADALLDYLREWGERAEVGALSDGARPIVPAFVVAAITQALFEGLQGLRAYLPEQITPEVYGHATRLVAHLFEEQAS